MDSDRNFLFGLTAVRSGLITDSQLTIAGDEWAECRSRTLAEILEEHGWITPDERSTVEAPPLKSSPLESRTLMNPRKKVLDRSGCR